MLELLVVLAIIAVGTAVVVLSVGRGWGGDAERRFAVQLAGMLRQAATRALSQGRPVTVFISPHERTVSLSEGGRVLSIPRTVRLEADGLLSSPDGVRMLVFYPDGGCGGAFFRVFGAGRLKAQIRVDALTGRVVSSPHPVLNRTGT